MRFNEAQQEAVDFYQGPCLTLAGPGSGKTAVITHRTKNLIEKYGVSPSEILVVTFTKAAAMEMKERFLSLTNQTSTTATFGTFHAVFFTVLKYAYHYRAENIIRDEQKVVFIRNLLRHFPIDYEDENECIQTLLSEISGVKNSGKTTLICRLLEIFKDKGLKVAVLKHDGHDFVPDVPGTDTYCQLQSGAYGTAVFSAGKYMLVKQQPQISEKELAEFFPEADLILLEGFKYSTYPKIEIIRKGNSAESVCNPEKLMAIATNLDAEERDALSVLENVPFFELDNAECIAEFILSDYFR